MQRIALEHLTAIDASPIQLAEAASAAGCDAICLIMQAMDVLPLMPRFDLITDRAGRAALRRRMEGLGIAVDVAHPFPLGSRTDPASFTQALECAADLRAAMVNVLIFDGEPARRLDIFGRFCDLAATFDLGVGLEFYPVSRVPALEDALTLVQAVNRPGRVGMIVDLLHLMRSGGSLRALAAAPAGTICYGQIADGPLTATADLAHEASSARLLPGEGQFDIAGFIRALPHGCPVSIEVPRDAVVKEESIQERVDRAVQQTRRLLDSHKSGC